MEWQDVSLLTCQPQAFALAHTQGGGLQYIQENHQKQIQ